MSDRNKLITSNLELPKIITHVLLKDYRNFKYRQYREDLISVGNVSLIEAADNYNPLEQVCFKTYASRRIEGDIKKYIRQHLRKVGQYVHIDSINLIDSKEEVSNDEEILEEASILMDELEPKDPIEKSIYYDVILGNESIRTKASELNISKSKVLRLKKKIISNLKEQYILKIKEEK